MSNMTYKESKFLYKSGVPIYVYIYIIIPR